MQIHTLIDCSPNCAGLSASASRIGHYGAIQMLYYYIINNVTIPSLVKTQLYI